MTATEGRPAFFITRQDEGLKAAVSATLHAIGGPTCGDSVFVKPNFTYPFEKKGVTTTRNFLVGLIEALQDQGVGQICIGEGEGGYNAFSMDQTFKAFRLQELKEHYGVRIANVNDWPTRKLLIDHRGSEHTIPFPAPLLTDYDCYISAPVPKVHCMTTISGAIKNQWGLIQDPLRLRLHFALDAILAEIAEHLHRPLAVCDGTYGLTRNGPMVDGEPLDLGWIAGANNLWLHDLMLCRLMRIPVSGVSHLQHAIRTNVAPTLIDCDLSPRWEHFVDDRFYLRRNAWNRLAKIAWHSRTINHLAYTSPVSGPLHKAMYKIRRKSPDLLARGVDWR